MARIKQTLCKSVDELMRFYFPKLSAEQKREERQANDAIRKAAGQEKASIHLRGKKQTRSVSLYLDQYTGKHEYEYLNMHLNIETSSAVKDANRATMEVATRKLTERRDDLLLKGIGITKKNTNSKSLCSYIDELADKKLKAKIKDLEARGYTGASMQKRARRSTYYILKGLNKHLSIYAPDATLNQVDLEFVQGFLEYLKTAKNFNFKRNKDKSLDTDVVISENHRLHMYRAFNNALNEAVKNKDIVFDSNPCNLLTSDDKPQEQPSNREYLDVDDVKLLIASECKHPEVKRAFLFSCFVALRFSDASTLTWDKIVTDKHGDLFVETIMRKSERIGRSAKVVKLPINKQAKMWLGEKGDASDTDLIFHLSDDETTNSQLKRWIKSAGITKKITYHCSRHTAATLGLSLKMTPQAVMKMLGHSKIDMTLKVYAKMIDDSMKEEVSLVDKAFQ